MKAPVGFLLNISGSNLTLLEAQEAADFIYESAGTDADIMFGAFDDDNGSDEIKITIIATGFNRQQPAEQPVAAPEKKPTVTAKDNVRPAHQQTPVRGEIPEIKSPLDSVVIPEFLLRKKKKLNLIFFLPDISCQQGISFFLFFFSQRNRKYTLVNRQISFYRKGL